MRDLGENICHGLEVSSAASPGDSSRAKSVSPRNLPPMLRPPRSPPITALVMVCVPSYEPATVFTSLPFMYPLTEPPVPAVIQITTGPPVLYVPLASKSAAGDVPLMYTERAEPALRPCSENAVAAPPLVAQPKTPRNPEAVERLSATTMADSPGTADLVIEKTSALRSAVVPPADVENPSPIVDPAAAGVPINVAKGAFPAATFFHRVCGEPLSGTNAPKTPDAKELFKSSR